MKRNPQIYIKPYSKRKRKKRLRRIFLALFTVLIIFTLTLYLFLSWLIKRESREIGALRSENQVLRREIEKFQNSDQAYEELLRVNLGYIRDGEKIIIYSEKTQASRNR